MFGAVTHMPIKPKQLLASFKAENLHTLTDVKLILLLIFSTQTRARLSFKRRLPTRQHRRSAGEEAEGFGSGLFPCELCSPKENGVKNQVLDSPSEEAECSLKQAENKEGDCETANAEMTKSDHDNREDMEHEAEQDRSSDASKEEQQASEPAEQKEGDIRAEERQGETPQEADEGGK